METLSSNPMLSQNNSSMDNSDMIQPRSYVGFDTITNQIERRLLQRGFQFNIMTVGESGLGKTTLLNTLFASHLLDPITGEAIYDSREKTTEITVSQHTLIEDQVRLNVNLIDTPGFGDHIDNDRCWEPIVKYIKEQHSQYLRKELTAQRERHILDTRVHAVLYFLNPSNIKRGLTPLDIITLKKLCDIVNVIPVIGKSDMLTLDERLNFRELIKQQLAINDIRIYPYDDLPDITEEDLALNNSIKSIIPFAVIGAEKEVEINGELVRGRKNRWGMINIEDMNQCEFVYLREFLIRTHLQDLIEATAFIHYEKFRSRQLIALKENASNAAHRQ